MRNNTVQLVEMKLVLITFLVALVAEAFQDERGWTVAADLFHAAGKSFYVEHKQTRKNFKRNRSNGFGVTAAFITTEMILHPKILTSDARVL